MSFEAVHIPAKRSACKALVPHPTCNQSRSLIVVRRSPRLRENMESLGGTVLAIAALVAAMLLAATFVLALIAHFVAPERIEAVLEKLSLPRAAGVQR